MKALTVKQPYAGLIASGKKTIETRTWQTKYRGYLLICSSLRAEQRLPAGYFSHDLCHPRGSTICIVKLVDCVPMTSEHREAAMCRPYDNAWAWMLEDIQPVRQIPVLGKLSIFEIPHLTMEDFFDEGRNWIEDFGYENGKYINTCIHCGELFKGHKRRVVCKLCDIILNLQGLDV